MTSNGTNPPEFLSPADTAWLRMDRPTNPMVVTGVFLFDKPLEFAQLWDLVEKRLACHLRLRQRVVEPALPVGRPHWEEDPTFDLRAHVHRIALPEPADEVTLRALIGDLMSSRLDLSRPLWQVYLIERYGRGSALVTRMHHCLGDGASMTRLLLSIADAEPGTAAIHDAAAVTAHDTSSAHPSVLSQAIHTADAVVHEGMDMILHPTHLLDLAKAGLDGAVALGRLLLLPADPQTLFKGPIGVVKRPAWSKPIALKKVKEVGRALNGTVNDVLLSAMAGSLRRYLLGRGTRVDESIRAVVPVNIRGDGPTPEFGNHFGLVFLSIPIEIGDTRRRFEEVKRRMDALKSTPESFVAFAILESLGATAPAVESLGVEVFSSKATMVMTNVPGPRQRISLAGVPVKTMMFWVPSSGDIGVGISILSYAGEVRLGVNADALLVPDPDILVGAFAEEFEALAELAHRPHAAISADAVAGAAPNGKESAVMAHIEKSIRIDAPVEKVYEVATDIARFPEWWPSLKEVSNFVKPHVEVDGTYDWVYNMMGLKYRGTDEFVEASPNEMYRSRSCAGDIQHAFEHVFAPEKGGTHYTLRIDYTPPGSILGRLADDIFLRRYNEKEADQVVENLKSICEREAALTPETPKAKVKPARPRPRKAKGVEAHAGRNV